MKVLHIINDLVQDGAEMALVRMALRMQSLGDQVSVVCLKGEGVLAQSLRDQGIPVTAVGLGFGPGLPGALLRLGRIIRRENPDVIQTWLYHSNLIGGVASRIARPRTPVVWGIHHSNLVRSSSKWTTILVSRLSALLSRAVPRRIVYCAKISRQTHEASGYAPGIGQVIPNGISIDVFHPDDAKRVTMRRELGVADDVRVIGIVARYHPDKDIPTFVAAAGNLAATDHNVQFVLVGKGQDASNETLRNHVAATGFPERFTLLGPRNDIASVLTAFDIASLSSITEAFPVSIIEAMAAGVPFVSTDVGDAREIIERTGRVVAVSDPVAMAEAWRDLLAIDAKLFAALGLAARDRVDQMYRLERTTDQYRSAYRSLLGN